MPSRLAPPDPVLVAHKDWRFDLVYAPYSFTTWRFVAPDGTTRYVKVGPLDVYPSIRDEYNRMLWLVGRLPVPRVLDYDTDGNSEWIVTAALPGRDATHPELKADPAAVVRTLAQGLRAFHAAPAEDCPFDFRLDAALEHARRRVAGDGMPASKGDFNDEHAHMTPVEVLRALERDRPRSEDVVLCHGDYCFPNVLIDGGSVVGYLDLGEVGLADRWWDLAVATWSCDWNVGPGFQDLFLESYGIEPDEDRIRYYRLLYELAS